MNQGKQKRVGALVVALILASWLIPHTALAQEGDVAVLVTEVIEAGLLAEEQQIAFWWSTSEAPQWTVSDEIIFDALGHAGIIALRPERTDISRIYRRPGLSRENAAQLGRLLDADPVLVGEIQYRRLAPVAPLGYAGVEGRAVVELVPAGDSEGVALERFTVTRRVYGTVDEGLLDASRRATGRALGEVMGQSLKRRGGEVGSQGDELLLALRNVERSENLELIRERLLAIDEVDRVVERWVSEGVIALSVEGPDTESGIADYASRVLENHTFEGFELLRSDRPSMEGVTEFWLQPRLGSF